MSTFTRENIHDVYTLSPLQEGIYFHSKLNPASHAYFEQLSLRIRGIIQPDILEATFKELVKRHSVLRTVFSDKTKDQPLQIALKQRDIDFYFEDISSLGSEGEKNTFVTEYCRHDRNRSFDLQRDVLIRATLFKLETDIYEIIISHHHIILDGWCFKIIAEELQAIYHSISGSTQMLPAPRQYVEYIRWLEKQNRESSKQCWEAYLDGYEEQAIVPRKPRSSQKSDGYAFRKISSENFDAAGVKMLCQQLAITPYNFFKAVWGIVLSRYNNCNDVVFGTIVSGRPPEIPNVESIMGLFINTVPVRVQTDRELFFLNFVQCFQQSENKTKRHEYYPLSDIQETSILKHDLIDHLLIFNTFSQRKPQALDERQTFQVLEWRGSYQTPYDFVLTVSIGSFITVDFEFNENKMDRTFVQAMAFHLESVVSQVLSNPSIKLMEIEMLTIDEKQKQLLEYSTTALTEQKPEGDSISTLLEEMVRIKPNCIAVMFKDQSVTFSLLNKMATHIGFFLRTKLNKQRKEIIGVALLPSEKMPIVLFGILKAGAGYLPLNIDDPPDRVQAIVADANIKIIITDSERISIWKADSGPALLDQNTLFQDIESNADIDLPIINSGSDVAIVFYTSGSTGTPKGVLVKHENIISFSRSYNQLFKLNERFKILSFANVSWDMSTPEIISAFLLGSTVCIIAREQVQSDGLIFEFLHSQCIDFAQFTPSHLQLFLDAKSLHLFKYLKCLLVGGEAMSLGLFKQLKAIETCRIVNVYGPTETTTWSTYYDLAGKDDPSIGRPMPGEEVYILSDGGKLLPLGIAGEICIGGKGVTEGYLNKPELTALNFIDHPFEKERRLYRTGDVGRFMPDGNIEFLGRKDNQIKVRGYRVEIPEIERNALEFPGVKDVLVCLISNVVNENSVALYFTRRSNKPTDILRQEPEKNSKILKSVLRNQVLKSKNSACIDTFPIDRSVCQIIDENAEKYPDRTAIIYGCIHVTYGVLNTRASVLAAYLANIRSLREDDIVAVVMHRSQKFAEVMLAVWKVNAAYLPIEPTFPPNYINVLLEDARPRIIIFESNELCNQIRSTTRFLDGAAVVILDEYFLQNNTQPFVFRPNNIRSVAYVMYTSGSTGNPKGVMIEHAGMVNHIAGKVKDFEINARSIVAQTASQCFDISVWQFMAALIVGGKTRVYGKEAVQDIERFINQLDIHGVTVLETVPTYLAEMMEILNRDNVQNRFERLAFMIVNADVLKPLLVQNWFNRFPRNKIANTFGITETSDDLSHYIMERLPRAVETIPVAKDPIQNCQIILLNEQLEACAPGERGEIFIGGIAVGRGYVNRPELTHDVFISTDDFPIHRFYKTGDMGRLTDEFELEFIGRSDNQVKIKGHRIEIEEVELRIANLEGIKDCAVLVNSPPDGIPYLHLFATLNLGYDQYKDRIKTSLRHALPEHMVPSVVEFLPSFPLNNNGKKDRSALRRSIADRVDGEVDFSNQLRNHLLKKLPQFMVPSFVIELSEFPLTRNGKIDRRRIPVPKVTAAYDEVEKPSTPEEVELLHIWKDILHKDVLGVNENFFEIGGHSLKATRIVSRIFKSFKVRLEIKAIFDHPTIKRLAAFILSLVQENYHTIRPLEECDHYAVSNTQQRFWLLEQIEDNKNAYNMISGYLLKGDVDRDRFQKAIEMLIDNFEILRTVFLPVGERLRQRVLTKKQISDQFQYTDVTGYEDTHSEVIKIIESKSSAKIDFERGPLFRVFLFKIAEKKYVLFFVVHHLVSDGRSSEVITLNLFKYYQSLKVNSEFVPARRTIQYKDFVGWQFAKLNSEKFLEHRNYWMRKLGGILPTLELPTSLPRPAEKTFDGDLVDAEIPAAIVRGIESLSSQNEVSLFMVLLTVLKTLFFRYTLQNDIIVGTSIEGRNHDQLEDQVGLFMNTVVLRTKIFEGDNFLSALQSVKETILEGYEHQDYPFDILIQDLNVKRTLDRSPMFDVLVEHLNIKELGKDIAEKSGGIGITEYKINRKSIKYDLNVVFFQEGDRLRLSFGYNSKIFTRDHVNSIVAHFHFLASQIIDNPFKKLVEYELILEEEENLIRSTFPKREVLQVKSIQSSVDRHAEANPDHIAIADGETQVSYTVLARRSRALASHFQQSMMLKKQNVIAVLLDRSTLLAETILALWRCGAIYMPIDPNYPENRIKTIIDDARPDFIVTSDSVCKEREFIKYLCETVFLVSDRTEQIFEREVEPEPDLENEEAYILYTSGSTGKPKGAIVHYHGMLNHICSKTEALKITKRSRVVQSASQCFDISIWQFFTALTVGGMTIIIDNEKTSDPNKFIDCVERTEATVVQVVPSYLSVLLESIEQLQNTKQTIFNRLKNLVTTGEALPILMARKWVGYFPHISLLNSYGPTEASDAITHFEITSARAFDRVLIGKSIPNMETYVLDSNFKLCPPYVMGEICVAGVGVGNGYLNQVEKTYDVFVDRGFRGRRIYRTGDLGRYLKDGNIELFGRLDNQVKIRGFRVELQEIEYYIMEESFVRNAKVLAMDDNQGKKQLVAFIETDEDEKTIAALRLNLERKLPAYMIPTHFKLMESLPITPNGKIDSLALKRNHSQFDHNNDFDYVPPSTPKEVILIHAVSELLGRHGLSMSANFFELGGDSIKAIQLTLLLSKLNYKLDVKDVFKRSSMRGLVECMREKQEFHKEIDEAQNTFDYNELSQEDLNTIFD